MGGKEQVMMARRNANGNIPYGEMEKEMNEATKERAEDHYGKGEQLAQQENFTEAIAQYKCAWRLDPNDTNYYSAIAEALSQLGNYEEALRWCDSAIAIDPEDPVLYFNRGDTMYYAASTNKTFQPSASVDEAIKSYDKAIELDPSDADFHAGRALSLCLKGAYREAILSFDRAILANPGDAGFYYNKGKILIKIEKYEEAKRCFDKGIEVEPKDISCYEGKGLAAEYQKKYDEAQAIYDKLISDSSSRVAGYSRKAQLLYKQKRYDEAIACYDRVLHFNESDTAAHFGKGNCLSYKREYEKALICYNQALYYDPENIALYVAKGQAYVSRQQYDAALAYFSTASRINPKSPLPHCRKGEVYRRMKQFTEALERYNIAMEIDPKFVEAFEGKGLTLRCLGKIDESIKCFQDACHITPNNPSLRVKMGESFYAKGITSKSVECYNKALEIDSSCSLAWLRLGDTQTKEEQYFSALSSYEKAIEYDPSNLEAYEKVVQLTYSQKGLLAAQQWCNKASTMPQLSQEVPLWEGNLLRLEGRYSEALECYDSFLATHPRSSVALIYKGETLRSMKQYSDAVQSYKSSIALDSQNTQAYIGKGLALMAMRARTRAINAFNGAKAIDRFNPLTSYYLGLAFLKLQKCSDAISNFNAAIDSADARSNDGKAIVEDAYIKKAEALHKDARKSYKQRNGNLVVRCYTSCLARVPNSKKAYFNYARMKIKWKQYNNALDLLDKRIDLGGSLEGAYLLKGDALIHLKRWTEAKKCYETCLSLKPSQKAKLRLETLEIHKKNSTSVTETNTLFRHALKELHRAFRNGNYQEIATMKNLNVRDEHGNTVLHSFIKTIQSDNFQPFMSALRGVSLNGQNNKGETILHIALQRSQRDIARCLIQFGADPHIQDHQGRTPHDVILESGNSAIYNAMFPEPPRPKAFLGKTNSVAARPSAASATTVTGLATKTANKSNAAKMATKAATKPTVNNQGTGNAKQAQAGDTTFSHHWFVAMKRLFPYLQGISANSLKRPREHVADASQHKCSRLSNWAPADAFL